MYRFLEVLIGEKAAQALFVGLALLSCLFFVTVAMAVAKPSRPSKPIITPSTAVAEGCCTLTVNVDQPGGRVPFGWYEVETQDGRAPRQTEGDFSDGKVIVPVGRDWIGRIYVGSKYTCPGRNVLGKWVDEREKDPWKVSNMLGGPYGLDPVTLVLNDWGC